MAIDGLSHDPDEIPEPDPVRPADKPRARPSPDRDPGKADQPPRAPAPDKDPEKAELTRAVGELASENADLYRRNAALDKKVTRIEAELKTEKDRRTAWSAEVARERSHAAGCLEAQTKINEALAARLADLEARQADKGAPGEAARRVGSGEVPGGERSEKTVSRPRMSNEFIGVGVAAGGGFLTAVSVVLETPVAADVTGLIISALGIGGASIPWYRKLRKDRNGDRSEG
jgi:hypothetical protein